MASLVLEESRKFYEQGRIPRDTPSERVRHGVLSAFNGRGKYRNHPPFAEKPASLVIVPKFIIV
jgi:hypothetical protein